MFYVRNLTLPAVTFDIDVKVYPYCCNKVGSLFITWNEKTQQINEAQS